MEKQQQMLKTRKKCFLPPKIKRHRCTNSSTHCQIRQNQRQATHIAPNRNFPAKLPLADESNSTQEAEEKCHLMLTVIHLPGYLGYFQGLKFKHQGGMTKA